MNRRHLLLALLLTLTTASTSGMQVLLRWDLETAPPPGLPGISSLALPWGSGKTEIAKAASDAGYQVHYLVSPDGLAEVLPKLDSSPVSGVIILSPNLRAALAAELQVKPQMPASTALAVAWQTDRFPQILSNSVQNKDGVLQVAAASSQPWIESNQAAAQILKQVHEGRSFLHHSWPADAGQPASVEDYQLAIAEAGACGIDLILSVERDFQQSLRLGKPEAGQRWREIAAYIEAYSRHTPDKFQPPENPAVIAEDFETWYELLKMLFRYNIPSRLVSRSDLDGAVSKAPDLVLFLATPRPVELRKLEGLLDRGASVIVVLERKEKLPWLRNLTPVSESDDSARFSVGQGRLVELYGSGFDPNALALDVRRMLGREHRPIQLWNGLTVLTGLYRQESSKALLYLVNYALSPQVVQARVAGSFSRVEGFRPETGQVERLKFENDNGFAEITIPGVKIGAIVSLSR